MLVLDTNTIIYYLENDKEVVDFLQQAYASYENIVVPTVVRLELFSKGQLTPDEEQSYLEFLQSVRHIDLDVWHADLAAMLRRKYTIKSPDAAIAATAIFHNATLVTRNVKDFKMIEELQLKEI